MHVSRVFFYLTYGERWCGHAEQCRGRKKKRSVRERCSKDLSEISTMFFKCVGTCVCCGGQRLWSVSRYRNCSIYHRLSQVMVCLGENLCHWKDINDTSCTLCREDRDSSDPPGTCGTCSGGVSRILCRSAEKRTFIWKKSSYGFSRTKRSWHCMPQMRRIVVCKTYARKCNCYYLFNRPCVSLVNPFYYWSILLVLVLIMSK